MAADVFRQLTGIPELRPDVDAVAAASANHCAKPTCRRYFDRTGRRTRDGRVSYIDDD